MWILGYCLLFVIIVWAVIEWLRQERNSDTLIRKHNISPSMLVMNRLGFNLDKQIAIFANWRTTYCLTEVFRGVIFYGERKDTDLSIDVPISDIKYFEIEDMDQWVSKTDKLTVYFKK